MTCHRYCRGEHDNTIAAFDEAWHIRRIAFTHPPKQSETRAKAQVPLLPEFTNHQQGLAEDRHPRCASSASMQGLWPQVHHASQTN